MLLYTTRPGDTDMNRGFLLGATVAAGALLLVPGVAVALGRAGRPIVRAAARTGTVAYREFQKAGAEVYEHMEDIAAEVEEELRAHREAAKTAQAESRDAPTGSPADAPTDTGDD